MAVGHHKAPAFVGEDPTCDELLLGRTRVEVDARGLTDARKPMKDAHRVLDPRLGDLGGAVCPWTTNTPGVVVSPLGQGPCSAKPAVHSKKSRRIQAQWWAWTG